MQELFHLTRASRALPIWLRYLVTTLLVAFAAAARLTLIGAPYEYSFLLFFPVIIIVGTIFDRGTAIYATLSSALLTYYLMSPAGGVPGPDHLLALAIYVIVGLFTAFVLEALHLAYEEIRVERDELRLLHREREALLDELSHRIRNDLMIAASLLTMQARSMPDQASRAALAAASERIQVLARVHGRLTMHGGSAVVDACEFIGDLCNDLELSLIGTKPMRLIVACESHPVRLQQAILLGLIVNELLTNTVKYAFPDERPGEAEVRFCKDGENYCLSVRDNGVGPGQSGKGSGFGRSLIERLVDTLGGTIHTEDAKPGLRVTVVVSAGKESRAITPH